jgi:pilus assembly protein CpaE
MSSPQISVGIQAPSAEMRSQLRTQCEATGFAKVQVEVDEYSVADSDIPTQRMFEVRPDVILVDMQDPDAAIRALGVLHTISPTSWLFVCGGAPDPKLIIDVMRAGAREFLPKPLTSRSLAEAFARFLDEKQRKGTDKPRGKVYAVTSAKGGSGATSVAINLATTVATFENTNVALTDLNSPVGDAAAYLNVKPQLNVMDALAAAQRLDSVLLESLMTRAHGISLLAGPKKSQLPSGSGASGLGRLLRVLSQTYSHSFIDMPSSLDQATLQLVAEGSEAIIVVLTPELPALWRTHRLILMLGNMGIIDRLRLVINRDSGRNDLDDGEIQKALNHPVYWRLPNNYGAAIRAINSGKPIVSVNHTGLASSYRELAQDLTGIAIPKKRRGFLGLFN